MYFPVAHVLHEERPCELATVPFSHTVHTVLASPAANVPGVHGSHTTELFVPVK